MPEFWQEALNKGLSKLLEIYCRGALQQYVVTPLESKIKMMMIKIHVIWEL